MASHLAISMSFSRQQWVEKYRSRLEGALGEYAKYKLAENLKVPQLWGKEVESLMKRLLQLYDKKKVKTKTPFDINKAAAEAFLEASTAQDQITKAKNQFIVYLTADFKKYKIPLKKVHEQVDRLDSEELLFELCEKHMSKKDYNNLLYALQDKLD